MTTTTMRVVSERDVRPGDRVRSHNPRRIGNGLWFTVASVEPVTLPGHGYAGVTWTTTDPLLTVTAMRDTEWDRE